MKIKSGDTVIVIAGKEKGKEGVIKKALPRESKVIVEGINMIKKHKKPSTNSPQGSIVEKEAPLNISKVAIKDPKTGKPTRVGYKFVDGKKVRFAKKSQEQL